MMSPEQEVFYALSVSLAVGLIIGAERGWEERHAGEGERVAGVRTHGLVGLLGGVSALLAQHLGVLVMGAAFTGLAVLVATVYFSNRHPERDTGITSLIALLLTFVFGALAVVGEVAAAAAAAVVTTLLLSVKPVLHRWLSHLAPRELQAALKLLLVSVVILPILPHQGYGSWGALDPYAIWWMVVLIAAISFAGYFAIKLTGPRRGILLTGILGGLASSTALTLHFARLARAQAAPAPLLAVGVLLACGTMLPRMLLVATLIDPRLIPLLAAPVGVMALLTIGPALVYWRGLGAATPSLESHLKNPLELGTALVFGLILALVMVLGAALSQWLGTAGVLALAGVSGLSDVDAITLSLARMSLDHLAGGVAALGMVLAAASNSLAKGAMAAVIGGPGIGWRVGLPLTASAGAGAVTAWLSLSL